MMKAIFRNKLALVLLGAALACLAGFVLLSDGNVARAATAEPNVIFKTVTWPNMDESGGIYGGTDTKGMLLTFDKNLSNDTAIAGGSKQKVNLAEQIGGNFLLNSIPMNTIEGAQICYFSGTHLWISAPGIENKTFLEIREGTQIFDAVLPEVRLCNHSQMFRGWHQEKDFVDVTYTEEKWWKSNYGEPGIAGGAKGVLLGFSENLSEASNGMKEYNFAKESVGDRVKLGGIPISEIEGAYLIYHSGVNLFVYAPNMFAYRTITIEEGTEFLGARFASGMKLYLDPTTYKWEEGEQSAEKVNFSAISWNSQDSSGDDSCGGGKGVLLTFDKNLSRSDKEDGTKGFIKSINLAFLPAAETITFNGKPLSQIEGANIRYFNGPHLWIQIPEGEKGTDDLAEGCAYNGVLSIEADTRFLDVSLPALTIYREGDTWGTEQNVYVNYLNEDGTAYGDRQKVKVGTSLQEPVPPTKPQTASQTFPFDGWYHEGVKWNFADPVTQPITLKAVFKEEVRKYTVTFDGKDGKQIEYETKVPKPADPVKDNTAEFTYEFLGWYDGNDEWDFENDVVTSDLNLVAKFNETKNSYKVTISFEGIDGKQPVELTQEYGTKVDFSKYDIEHYSFEIFNDSQKISEFTVEGEANLKIVYAIDKFTVTFDGKDGKQIGYGAKSPPIP